MQQLLTNMPEEYLPLIAIALIAGFVGGYLVGYWSGKQDHEDENHYLRSTLSVMARQVKNLQAGSRKTQETKTTRRLTK